MPAGSGLAAPQQLMLRRVVAIASERSGLRFRVYLGDLPGGREQAEGMLAGLGPAAAATVLVAVDPGARSLEIVTGTAARARLDDRACALAALTMTSAFAEGNLAGGLRSGLLQLAENARAPRTLHADQP